MLKAEVGRVVARNCGGAGGGGRGFDAGPPADRYATGAFRCAQLKFFWLGEPQITSCLILTSPAYDAARRGKCKWRLFRHHRDMPACLPPAAFADLSGSSL